MVAIVCGYTKCEQGYVYRCHHQCRQMSHEFAVVHRVGPTIACKCGFRVEVVSLQILPVQGSDFQLGATRTGGFGVVT